MVATPKMPTATSSVRPTRRTTGRRVSTRVTAAAPMPPAARSQPRPTAPDAQALLGDGGQQGDGPAEEHGEQVERDGAEQDRVAPDEAQALQGVVQAGPHVAASSSTTAGSPSPVRASRMKG